MEFSGFGVFPERLYEQVEPGIILPLWALHIDIIWRNPVPMDVMVCEPHQSDGNPNIDVYVRPRLGLLPLCCKAAGYTFQGIHCLHTQ